MTLSDDRVDIQQYLVVRPVTPVAAKGSRFGALLRTTDHKTIGKLHLVTAFGYFIAGGAMAMLMRAELARPGR